MEDGGTKPSSGLDDTIPASTAPERSSLPSVAPPPDARYQLGKELGRGGMGRVVEAYDTHLRRTVALKEVLPKGGNIERRFQREVRITARLEHASIVPVYDSGRLADGRPFYVMRRVSGRPLDEMIARAGTLDGRLALLPNVLAAIDAVAHAHSRSVIHRDLKPQNILVGELGETVVIDWGLAKVLGDDDDPPDSLEPHLPSAADSVQTQVGSVFGTPGFMAPEQARGDELGPPGDVYALGATLYQMLVGKPPFGGTSATEMIVKTLRNRIEPIATAAPGAPAELATIIEKALAYEPADRYRDAGELAEDVRRFLTGQLVGAHHYTPRQRLSRFVRRHRVALIVAALASVGIAVLAWISVHSILRERDAAEQASEEARVQREKADARAGELRERADQLLVAHARALINDNPTQAIAVLKQVADSRASADAVKAIARAAILRGVAWGMPALSDLTVTLEMSPDARRVAQVDRNGLLQVVDLDAHRVLVKRSFKIGTRAYWVDEGRRLAVLQPRQPLTLFDPVAGTEEALALPDADELAMSEDGEHLATLTQSGQATLYDLARRQATPLPVIKSGQRLDMSPDGRWLGITDRQPTGQRFVILDANGRAVASREGTVMAAAASGTRFAVAFWKDAVYEIDLAAPDPHFTVLPLEKSVGEIVHNATYVAGTLYLMMPFSLLRWTGTAFERVDEYPSGGLYLGGIVDDTLVSSGNDGQVYVRRGEMQTVLRVPTSSAGMVRVATRPTSSRIVVAAREALVMWDARTFMPTSVPFLLDALFSDETTVMSPAPTMQDWRWYDVLTGKQRSKRFGGQEGLIATRDVEGGRVMVTLNDSESTSTGTVVYPDGREIFLPRIAWNLARLVRGDGVVFSPGKGRVLGMVGMEQPRELASLDSDLASLTPLGPLGYAALSEKGELVRGFFDGHGFQRTVVTGCNERSFIAGETSGSVLLACGPLLRRWNGMTVTEVTRVSGGIERIYCSAAGTLVVLPDQSALYLRAGSSTPEPVALPRYSTVAIEGTRAAGVTAGNQVEIFELPSRISWTLPRVVSASKGPALSPSGSWLYQALNTGAILWKIPEPGSDLGEWLDSLTNGVESGEHLQWPWASSP